MSSLVKLGNNEGVVEGVEGVLVGNVVLAGAGVDLVAH